MPVHFEWYDEGQRVLCFRFKTPWTVKEFETANNAAGKLVEPLEYTVDAIFDLSEASLIPSNALSAFIRAAKHAEAAPNQGVTVVIGVHLFIRRLTNVIAQLARQQDKIRVVKDFDEAQQRIAQLQAQRQEALHSQQPL